MLSFSADPEEPADVPLFRRPPGQHQRGGSVLCRPGGLDPESGRRLRAICHAGSRAAGGPDTTNRLELARAAGRPGETARVAAEFLSRQAVVRCTGARGTLPFRGGTQRGVEVLSDVDADPPAGELFAGADHHLGDAHAGVSRTVVGITQALGDLDPQLLATDPKSAMQGLLAGLYVAFDTTAEALSLSMVLMFVQFFADRFESHLLGTVDQRAAMTSCLGDSPRKPGRRSSGGGGAAHEQRRVESGSAARPGPDRTLEADDGRGQHPVERASRVSGTRHPIGPDASLDTSLRSSPSGCAGREQRRTSDCGCGGSNGRPALSDNARLLHSQQTRTGSSGRDHVAGAQATGEVIKLEQALNDNLRALAGASTLKKP